MDLFADIPSSPLSSAPSDLESQSPSHAPAESSNVGRKRKVIEPATTTARATRRKTGDDFPSQLAEIRDTIVLPKVKKATVRKGATKKDVAPTTKTADQALKLVEFDEVEQTQNDALTTKVAVIDDALAEELSALKHQSARRDRSKALPEARAAESKSVEDKLVGLVVDNEVKSTKDEEVKLQQKQETEIVDEKQVGREEWQGIVPAVEITAAQNENKALEQDETIEVAERQDEEGAQATASDDVENIISKAIEPIADHAEDELVANSATQSLELNKGKTTQNTERDSITARPSRRRMVPTKLADDHANPKPVTATSKRKSQPVRGNWSTEHLLTNSKSKLATCDLSDLLSQERAWTLLDRSEQLELIAMLPTFIRADLPEFPTDMEIPNILRQVMKSNTYFREDIRLLQEDLAAGRYDPQWQKEAQEATEKRAAGAFDSWKEQNREEFWGQKQKVDWGALSGESAQYTLTDLAKAGLFEVDDLWSLRVSRNGMVVNKEAKIIAITPDHSLTLSYPPGQHKFSALSNGEDVVVEGIKAPKTLCDAMLKEDGRLASVRVANAWRDFRCIRRHQDMGSLFDVRELYSSRQST